MRHNLIETVMGAVVLLVAAFFLVFAYTSSGVRTTKGYPLVARFERIDGLNVGSEVRLSGVRVGTVIQEDIDTNSYLAVVKFEVNSNIRLPKDTSAEIISDGLLGNKYIALVPGGEETFLQAEEEVVHTQASVSLESLIGQAIFRPKESGEQKKPE